MSVIARILSLLLLVIGTAACAGAQDMQGMSAMPDAASIAAGREIYAEHCVACHGANLEGEADWKQQNPDGSFRAPPHDDSGHTWHHSDAQLIAAVREGGARLPADIGGTSNMPAYATLLTDEQIVAVLTFIKSTWSAESRAYQQQVTQQATP